MPSRCHLGTNYRPDLDGLRAVAVLGVVAFHADAELVTGGFSGVDIFFVISGYLISRLIIDGLSRGTFGFRDFFGRRMVRLVPALAVVLMTCWAAGWLTLLPAEYAQLGTHVAAAAGFVANIVFWRESGYFDAAAAAKPLLHLWSLGVEEQFYLLWPLGLAFAWWRRLPLLPIVLGAGVVSFAINVSTIHAHPSAAFYLLPARLWELAAGGVLACVSYGGSADDPRLVLPGWLSRLGRGVPMWIPPAASAAGVALLAASLVVLGGRAVPGWWALLPVTGTLLVIGSGPRAWVNRVLLAHPVLTFVGIISYPLYLWHWPILTLTRIFTSREPRPLLTAAAVGASGLLAWLTWRFVERPAQAGYRAGGHRWLPARLAAVLAVPAALGLWVQVWSRELPARFPASVQYLVDFNYDYASAYREGRCYLTSGQTQEAFADECVDPPGAAGMPLLVLWGDSHAAHMYPGLRALQRDRPFRMAQFTGSACPPLLSLEIAAQPYCRDVNEAVLDRIGRLRPQVVLLGARWDVYDYSRLDQTVERLRRAGVARVVLLGQLPNWTDRIPRLLFNEVRRDPLGGIPRRLPFPLGREDDADRALRERAERLGVVFVSAYRMLCNAEGCLVKLGTGPGGLTTWDDHHLTSDGSLFVATRLAPHLFAPARRRRER